jgi:nitronate monooxygenase
MPPSTSQTLRQRVDNFRQRFDLRVPILLAPMASASPPPLSIAVAQAGGLGACGVLAMAPEEILEWSQSVRAAGVDAFQLNNWIPGPATRCEPEQEAELRAFLAPWGPAAAADETDAPPPNFAAQCEAMLAVLPPVVSSVMGLYPSSYVRQLKRAGIAWFATVSTVAEARQAQDAGADGLVAQGMEAGGHRGCFEASAAERQMVGLVALLPAIADTVQIPVVAAGGIADGRGIAAALLLGASAVQIGTGFLRCPEAGIHPQWAAALGRCAPEDTLVSRALSGRAGRTIATAYVRAATESGAPTPAAYPIQRRLTAAMRRAALREGDVERMQAWAGQSAQLARVMPARRLVEDLWQEARNLLTAGWG